MDKKGFTLIELLATITILALLTVVASTSVTKVLKESKGDLYKTQIKLVESAAKTFVAENMHQLPNEGECKFITIKNLQDNGLIDKNIYNPKTGEKIDTSIKIKITTNQTGYGYNVPNYEINPESVEGCSHFQPCILLDGKKNEIGSKYECEVKEGTKYNFYVLSHEEAGTTNLIMERNICEDGTPADSTHRCYYAYNADGNSLNSGPVTAMTKLNNATSDWNYISNLNLIYSDERGHFTGFDVKGKVRLPYYNELNNAGCKDFSANAGSCPLWLVDYLNDYSQVLGQTYPTHPLDYIYGYWTFSSTADSSKAFNINYYGSFGNPSVNNTDINGIRPVINVKL